MTDTGGARDLNDPFGTTDAGVRPQSFSEEDAARHVPMEVILNNEVGILRRKRAPVFCINRHKFFLHLLNARQPSMSIPTIYPETMIYPKNFWKQNDDCSYAGSLPSCRFGPPSMNHRIG